MKNTFKGRIIFAGVLCWAVLGISCQDNLSYYDMPKDMKGSIYETLQERGNYSTFLNGVDIAGYAPLLQGKGIWTVMAPNNDAFAEYLKSEYGAESIEDLSVEEVQKLIGFHILYYSFDKNKLVNFRPNEGDGATEEEQMVNAGLYYKFRTKSQDAATLETDTVGNKVNVYHLERFVPVFSYRMFQTKQIDAKRNYEYFYPGSSWEGADGFNVSNASVDEYEIITSTGYVYLIDKVLKPLETIYNEMKKAGTYNTYLNFYNEYEHYDLDETLTREYGNGTDLYQHLHSPELPNIATEWPVTDYKQMTALSSVSYSIFAPNDDAWDNFYKEYWGVEGTGYPQEVAYDAVSPDVLRRLLENSIYAASIVFPEEIERGDIKSSLGTVISFDVDNVPEENRKICVNGALYGCDELTPPPMFSAVTGPAYQYKRYSNFQRMMENSDLEESLYSEHMKYIVLYPSDDQLARNGITYDAAQNTLLLGQNKLSASEQQKYVYTHVAAIDGSTTTLEELPTSGKHVFATLMPDNKVYWYVKNGKITNSYLFDQLIPYTGNMANENSVYCEVSELTFKGDNWTNGHCYAYDGSLFEGSFENMAIPSKFIAMMVSGRTDEITPFCAFIQLLIKAGMIDIARSELTAMTESSLMLIPTNNAVKEAVVAGKIPGIATTATANVPSVDFFNACTVSDPDALQKYLKVYFIPLSTASISNYPFVGWGENTEADGGLITLDSENIIVDGRPQINATHVNIYDDGTKLSAEVAEPGYNGRVDMVGDYDYFPFVFDDGCVQFINGVL